MMMFSIAEIQFKSSICVRLLYKLNFTKSVFTIRLHFHHYHPEPQICNIQDLEVFKLWKLFYFPGI